MAGASGLRVVLHRAVRDGPVGQKIVHAATRRSGAKSQPFDRVHFVRDVGELPRRGVHVGGHLVNRLGKPFGTTPHLRRRGRVHVEHGAVPQIAGVRAFDTERRHRPLRRCSRRAASPAAARQGGPRRCAPERRRIRRENEKPHAHAVLQHRERVRIVELRHQRDRPAGRRRLGETRRRVERLDGREELDFAAIGRTRRALAVLPLPFRVAEHRAHAGIDERHDKRLLRPLGREPSLWRQQLVGAKVERRRQIAVDADLEAIAGRRLQQRGKRHARAASARANARLRCDAHVLRTVPHERCPQPLLVARIDHGHVTDPADAFVWLDLQLEPAIDDVVETRLVQTHGGVRHDERQAGRPHGVDESARATGTREPTQEILGAKRDHRRLEQANAIKKLTDDVGVGRVLRQVVRREQQHVVRLPRRPPPRQEPLDPAIGMDAGADVLVVAAAWIFGHAVELAEESARGENPQMLE